MEFRISVDELKKALHRAQGIVERKAAMPILANVLINATKGGVTVTAFDLDTGIVSEHPADVAKPGSLTLGAKTLFDIVSNLPDAHVTIKRLPNNYAELECGAANFRIVGMGGEEYPKLPKGDSGSWVTVSGATLLEMSRKTTYAISLDETRYILNGVYFEPRGNELVRMVATDGHRLALIERTLPGDFRLKGGVVLPRKGLFELKRLLEEAPDANCQLAFAESSALFRKPGLFMVMRLLDGQFPEYQRVIPKESEKQLLLRRVRLSETLKRIALLSTEKASAVRLQLSENLLRISVNNPDLGEAKDDLEVAYRGPDLTIGFNARYILDVLQTMDTDDVVLEMGDEHSPCVMHAPGDRSYTSVVMPMRV